MLFLAVAKFVGANEAIKNKRLVSTSTQKQNEQTHDSNKKSQSKVLLFHLTSKMKFK